jgi:hypothetical protein
MLDEREGFAGHAEKEQVPAVPAVILRDGGRR